MLVRDLERLWALTPGGSAERPRPIASPAQVEPIAAATPCPLCAEPLRLDAHEACVVGQELLRVARLRCTACGIRRALFFRVQASLH